MIFANPAIWWCLVVIGMVVMPWHMQQSGLGLHSLGALFSDSPDRASLLAQALFHKRFWFWPVIVSAFVCIAGILPGRSREDRARWLVIGGVLGLATLVGQGLMVGLRGWQFPWANALFGELDERQFGFGWGAVITTIGFLLLLTDGAAWRGAFKGDRFTAGSVGILILSIIAFTFWPVFTLLQQAFNPVEGQGAITSFLGRFVDQKIWGLRCLYSGSSCGVAWNTLALATATATCATILGLCFALIVTRTQFRGKKVMRLLTVLPIITPPFVIGLGLILIFGRSGVINQWVEALTGAQLGRWIYGFNGVMLAQVFSFTPTAFLVLIGVVEGISPSLEEASTTLRANRTRTFMTVTLPLMRPGLANAFLVVFIESLADFGNPIVLGGSFGVLSTEIFFAVVGAQADFGRAAMLATLMLVIALGVFFIQRAVVGKKSYVSMTGKGDSGLPVPLPDWARRLAYGIAVPWAVLTVAVYGMALAGGFVKVWGRDWTLTLSHYARAFAVEVAPNGSWIFSGGAWGSLKTTLLLAGTAAPITAAFGLLAAWILSRQQFRGRTALEFALMLTFAVPGTVIGVAYILTYNVPPLEITGTGIILIVCFVFRNLPVGVRSGLAAMSQLDKSLDEASTTLRASTWTTLTRVVLPLIKPAIVTALVYSFVRAMTTVSAVIFLVSAQYEMATVFIINRVINGDYGLAIAYSSTLIVLMLMVIGLIQLTVGKRRLGRRASGGAPASQMAGGPA